MNFMRYGSTLFNECHKVVSFHEGARYVDDPDDAGGATAFGISLLFAKGTKDLDCDGWLDGDINHDRVIDKGDIKGLTHELAAGLYWHYFWRPEYECFYNKLLALHVYDMAVNAGSFRAHNMLQQAVNAPPFDGVIGKITLGKVWQCSDVVVNKYIVLREVYYSNAAMRGNNHKYLAGWLKRVETTRFF